MTRMHVEVNGVRLAFRTEPPCIAPGVATALAADPRPRLVSLHGGPAAGFPNGDPSTAPSLGDAAERVWLELRGSGGSEAGPSGSLQLQQWAWDLRIFCATAGVERPVVLAARENAAVALLYAACSPSHPSGLVLFEPVWEVERLARWRCPDHTDTELATELPRVTCPVLAFASAPDTEASARALLARLTNAPSRLERVPRADVGAVSVLTAAFLAEIEDG